MSQLQLSVGILRYGNQDCWRNTLPILLMILVGFSEETTTPLIITQVGRRVSGGHVYLRSRVPNIPYVTPSGIYGIQQVVSCDEIL